MEKDLIQAKKYLSEQGYGNGTNYTTNLVAVLLANYAASHPPAAPVELGQNKPFIVANVREIVDQVLVKDEISYSKMVELLNDVAQRYYEKFPAAPVSGEELTAYRKPFRIGRKTKRAILDAEGQFVGVFSPGNENAAKMFCDWANGANLPTG